MSRRRREADLPTPEVASCRHGDFVDFTVRRNVDGIVRGVVFVGRDGAKYVAERQLLQSRKSPRTYLLVRVRIQRVHRDGVLVASVADPYPWKTPRYIATPKEHVYCDGDVVEAVSPRRPDEAIQGLLYWKDPRTPQVRTPDGVGRPRDLMTLRVLRVWRDGQLVAEVR